MSIDHTTHPDRSAPTAGWPALVGLGRRSDGPVAVVLVVLLAVMGAVAAIAPRVLAQAESESLDEAIADANPLVRRLSVRVVDSFDDGLPGDPLAPQREALADISAQFDDSLLEAFGESRIVSDTNRFAIAAFGVDDGDGAVVLGPSPSLPTLLTLRIHPEIDEHSRIVEGRAAAPTGVMVDDYEVIEIELSVETAAELEVGVGDRLLLTVDTTDTVTRQFDGGLPDDFVVEVVGLRELDPPDDLYWFGDRRLHRPTITDTAVGANVFVFASIGDDQLPGRPFAVDGASPFAIEERRDLDPERIDVDSVDEVLAGLVELEASFADRPTLRRPGVTSSLRPVLETEIDQRQAARTAVQLAAVGVVGVAIATLTQLIAAAFVRRRGWLTVARARGATRRQMVASTIAETGLVAVIGLVIGVVAAVAVVGGAATPAEMRLAVSSFVAAVACGATFGWLEGSRPLTADARSSEPVGLARVRRVGGALLVVIAVASVVTFRRRGVAVDAPELDLLVLALPVVVPLAVVVVTQRLVPRTIGAIASNGSRLAIGRLVGLRRAAASPSTGVAVVLGLALTVASIGIGVFRALDQGAVDASWSTVGAPYRIDTTDQDLVADLIIDPELQSATQGATRITLLQGDDGVDLQFFAVDTIALGEITAGTVADPEYPVELTEAADPGVIPVLAADRINGRRVRVGDEFLGAGNRSGQVFRVVDTRAELFGRSAGWLLADAEAYERESGSAVRVSTVYVDDPPSSDDALMALDERDDVDVVRRVDVLDANRNDPLSRAVRYGYLAAGGVALALALVALVAIVVVTARSRRRELAVLGLLGAEPKVVRQAVAAELLPVVAFAALVGTLTGWGVARLYAGRIDLSAFAAGEPVSIRPSLVWLAAAAGVVLLLASALVLLGARRVVKAEATELLRIEGSA